MSDVASIVRRLPGWLEFWVAISAAIALASTGLVVFYALGKLASEVNNIDLALTRQSARAAVTAFEMRLRDNLQDYANWDDAALKLYGVPDQDFVNDILKDVTETAVVFDTAYLIDENGKELAAYKDGESIGTTSSAFIGASLQAMMGVFEAGSQEYKASSGLVVTPGGIAAAAIGLVVPYSADISIPDGQRRFLLIAKHLTPQNVERMRHEFVIPDLKLVPANLAGETTVPLINPLGMVIGSLGWETRTPGTIALNQITPAVWLILGLLSAVTAGIVVFACVSVRQAYTSRIRAEHAASHDFLTGLPNRAALKAWYEENGSAGELADQNVAVVFLDLDGFKQVNDAYGHEVGDRLLRACAAGFSFLTGTKGTIGRVGGDEFAVLVHGREAYADAVTVAHTLIEFLKEPFSFEERDIKISTSAGIACGDARRVGIEELMRRADIAMYQAKKDGGNRVASYDAEIDLKLRERVALAVGLREALKLNKISVAYQAVIDAQSKKPIAVEALARWVLADGTTVAPDIFIPLAEEHGLIEDVGKFVLRQACLDAARWDQLVLCVNVSPIQLHSARFDEVVAGILSETGFPPHRLDLEFTERHLINDPEQAFEAISRLRALGISISLDDFGTGYSSIGYLKQFNFDRLKLDQTICADVINDTNALQMIQGTIAIARSLGLEVTAEGVENEYQAQFLRLAGCSRLQGFWYSVPVGAAEFQRLVADHAMNGRTIDATENAVRVSEASA